MVVVKFLVAMFDPVFVQLSGKDAAAVVDVVLIAPSAIDVDSLQRFIEQQDSVLDGQRSVFTDVLARALGREAIMRATRLIEDNYEW